MRYDVVCPIERGEGDNKKTTWVRCGSAWAKEDGRWSIMLDVLPVNGRLMIFPPKDQKTERPGRPQTQNDIPF